MVFAFVISAFGAGLFIVAGFAPGATISIPSLPFPITTTFLLPIYGYFIPGVFCLFIYPESRASLWKVKATWFAYGVAIVGGQIPFLSYLGSHKPAVPLTVSVTALFIVDFLVNLFLRPLWEAIMWRGIFQKGIRSFCSTKKAIFLSSLASTVSYGGYLAFLSWSGTAAGVVAVVGGVLFCQAIMLGSLYEVSRGNLWPCVVLHAGLVASEIVYYTKASVTSEFGPRVV
ncbi:MAG: CPBP family intramembrane metalloprotease, partial [Acidobacteriia bacterium]|nr:CPBP family intramembrane metalloprotease [Terriglobia bacterium]